MVSLTVKQSGTAIANKVYVGNTQAPIQQAVDYANTQGGGTIFIEKGTYAIASPISLYSNIKVCGEYFGTKLVPIMGQHLYNKTIYCNGTSEIELNNIVIEALTIGGDTATKAGGVGIECKYCGKAQTTGLSSGGYDSSTVGVNGVNKIGVTIKDCIIQNNYNHGISFGNCSNSTAIGNDIQYNGHDGMSIYGGNNSNIFIGNTTQNNLDNGIRLYESSNNTLIGNTCQNNKSAGIMQSSSRNNTITGNTVQNNGDSGIKSGNQMSGMSGCTITGNTIQNNYGNGIGGNMGYCSIDGNTVQNNNDAGIAVIEVSGLNTVCGNTCKYNKNAGIFVSGGSRESNNNTITGNIYTNISVGGFNNINASTHNQAVSDGGVAAMYEQYNCIDVKIN